MWTPLTKGGDESAEERSGFHLLWEDFARGAINGVDVEVFFDPLAEVVVGEATKGVVEVFWEFFVLCGVVIEEIGEGLGVGQVEPAFSSDEKFTTKGGFMVVKRNGEVGLL